jgi:quinoprotein glucose dehydrogenase
LLLGYSGGAEWGGNAGDTDGIFYQNANEAFWDLQMISMADWQKELARVSRGKALYITNCSACHGADRKGSPGQFPDLTGIGFRRTVDEISGLIGSGSGKMPSFLQLSEDDRKAIAGFLTRPWFMPAGEHSAAAAAVKKDSQPEFPYQPPYTLRVWKQFTDREGYPGVKPPWGTLNAIDLNTGEYRWRVPLGEYPELAAKGVPITGTESYGGPLVTAGGLVFIAGTRDRKLRAFDARTGQLVWEYLLPAAGFATPVTYAVEGRQYIAIAAGGGKGTAFGRKYVAFALDGSKAGY